MVNLKINSRDILAEPSWTVLQAAQHAGITIPTLCNHKDLTPTGAFRMCRVGVSGVRGMTSSCTPPVA